MITRLSFRRILAVVTAASLLACGAASAGTITVTNTHENLAGSLRQAIQDANPGDVIVFAIPRSDSGYNASNNVFTITLTSPSGNDADSAFGIAKDLTIDGAGSKILITRSSANGTPNFRIFNITAGNVTLRNLSIYNGYLGPVGGGAIYNTTHLSMRNCTIANSFSGQGAGGIENTAAGVLEVINSTFFGNTTGSFGRAIANSGTARVLSCTIDSNPGGMFGAGTAAVANAGTMRIGNTIIAGNEAIGPYSDVHGSFTSEGYNFIGDPLGAAGNASTGFGASGSHDQLGTHASPANPGLYGVEFGTGSTPTFRPAPGSLVIDQGNRFADANGTPTDTDQRGQPRPIDQPGIANAGDGSDIGAVELGAAQTGPAFTVTGIADRDDGVCTDDDCTLREAINAANANADANTIVFAPGVAGTILNTVFVSGLPIANPLTINGPGANLLTISGDNANRIVNVFTGVTATISGLTFASGETPTHGLTDTSGGAIENFGTLTLDACEFDTNYGGSGGAVANLATLTVTNCAFVANRSTGNGGALRNTGTLTVTNSTFDQNSSVNSGAISSFANTGGPANATLTNCTVTNNTATDPNATGGGLNNGVNSTMTVRNTLVAFNSTPNAGGGNDVSGIFNSGGHNLIRKGYGSYSFIDGVNGDLVGDSYNFARSLLDYNGGPTRTLALLAGNSAIDKGNDANAPARDQRGYSRNGISDIGAFEFGGSAPSQLLNLSTRKQVGTGDNVLIGGFIIVGSEPKKIIVRGIGPTLPVNDSLADPALEIHSADSALLGSNNNWRDTQEADIAATGLAPASDAESAILISLPAQPAANGGASYTAVLAGNGGGTGIGLLDMYDLAVGANAKLANISTRGYVGTGDDLLIGGFIPGPADRAELRVLIRGLGPSLPVDGAMQDPVLELHDGNGNTLVTNDNWTDAPNAAEISATGIPPSDNREAAILISLPSSNSGYTALVRGASDSTGVALVEVYALN